MPADESFNSATNGNGPTITRTVTKQVVPFTSSDLVDPDVVLTKKHEEWTTSKRVVNHKTKQVETRVQRQLVIEDGRVVADSGPQVTTKTKEDVRVEESENSDHKTTGDDTPGPGYTLVPGSAQVISEKTESKQTMTETKEENRQMHDERMKDLSGEELHQRIIVAPDDTNFGEGFCNFPGRLTHYSSKSQRVVDKEEVKEVSELKDGEVSTETTRTHHHEEAVDDEVPEEDAEEGMVPERSAETSRKIQYFTDPREFESATEQLREESRRSYATLHKSPAYDNHEHNGNEVPAVTHKWLDDHFGSKTTSSDAGSDHLHETTRTRSGGNRITIEMTGHRSSPSELSPTDSIRKHDISRDSTLRNRSTFERSEWNKNSHEQSPSPPYPSSSLSRNHTRITSSPFDVSSSSGSSRSKTPVKTFYLGEENTYKSNTNSGVKKKNNKAIADILKSNLSFNETTNHNTFTRSDSSSHFDSHRNDSYFRSPTPKYKTPESTLTRNGTFNSGPIYSNVRKPITTKNIQVSMSDEEDEVDRSKTSRIYREHRFSNNNHISDRSSTTLPRNMKTYTHSKSLLTPVTTSSSKHYKSSESLLSPNYSNYSSSFDYGSTNSFRYADQRSSPVYNYSPSGSSTLKNSRNHHNDYNHSHYTDSYSTNRSNRSEYKSREKNDSYRREESKNSYETTNGRRNGYSPKQSSWNTNGYLSYKNKTPTSPPESGYQSPLPPSPPYSPPPRLIKVFNSDHYGSTSSISPPDSPRHTINTASIKRGSAFPSGTTSRSKSSGDLRSSRLLPSPTSFSPLSSPSELKTMGEKTDRQKYYRVKPGDDGRSVVVQVRDWQGR